MADVAMPRLSDSMEEGTILKWLKSDGDDVSKGEELVEIETDKANMTYEADQEGTLKIVAQEGDTLAVGETIASIGGGSNGAAKSADAAESADADSAEEEPEPEAAEPERDEAPAPAATAEAEPATGGGNGGPPA
jgi:pyruvate dehydrogenase E2 component (dihydrolipoamide acetyltransferase)